MLRASLESCGLRVEVFAAEGSEHPCQDRWLVHPFGSTLRVAVADGCTPWRTAPVPGDDAAAFAAATVVGCLLLPLPAREALLLANRALHDAAVVPSRRQAMATACVVDVQATRWGLDCRGVVASDCEWWVQGEGEPGLRLLVGGEARTSSAMEASRARLDREPLRDDSVEAVREREAEDFEDSQSWRTHAIGRVESPRLIEAAGRFERIVIASDGGLIGESPRSAALHDLGEWLRSVEERDYRDDFTVICVEPSGRGAGGGL